MEPSLHCQSVWWRRDGDISAGDFPQAKSYCWAVGALVLPRRGSQQTDPPPQQTSPCHMIQGNCVLLIMTSNLYYFSAACGIDLGDSYVVTGGMATGGEYSLQRVAQYSLTGEVTYLADLQQGRSYHACTSFIDDDAVTVSFVNIMKYLMIVIL